MNPNHADGWHAQEEQQQQKGPTLTPPAPIPMAAPDLSREDAEAAARRKAGLAALANGTGMGSPILGGTGGAGGSGGQLGAGNGANVLLSGAGGY